MKNEDNPPEPMKKVITMNTTLQYANNLYQIGVHNNDVFDTIKNCSKSKLKETKEGLKYFIANEAL